MYATGTVACASSLGTYRVSNEMICCPNGSIAREATIMIAPTEARIASCFVWRRNTSDPQGPLLALSKCWSSVSRRPRSVWKYNHLSWLIHSATTKSIEVLDRVINVDIMVLGSTRNCQFERGLLLRYGRVAMMEIMQAMLMNMPPVSHAHDDSSLAVQSCHFL